MTTTELAASALLTSARRRRAEAAALEVEIFVDAVEWAAAHEVTEEYDAATWHETSLPIAGPGAPLVAEFCVAEFGAALGMSTDGARAYLGQAVELAHRLPRLWGRVLSGKLPVWRARRIAERTILLSVEAATYVDVQLAPYAHRTGPVVTDRLVEEAVLRFMPDLAAEKAAQAAEGRHVTIAHDREPGSGMSSIFGTLDSADAIDLETALRDGAAALRAAGSEDTLDVRRSVALGELARGSQALAFGGGAPAEVGTGGRPARTRDLTMYVHLDANDPAVANLENAGGHLITHETLSRWISTGDARVVIKPVIDLSSTIATSAYTIPDKIREHVILRNPTCIFPGCNRPSRHCDLDHIEPFDPDGPPGQTSTGNLAPLCRRHHRHKTFGRWSYTMLEPGVFLWRSPHGYTYLVDRDGTTDLTPPPVDPTG